MLAVVPVKGRDGAKSRLAPLLRPEERTQLVLDMLERVLTACAEAESITGTLLVTPDPSFAPGGVAILRDAGTGHADAVALALRDERARRGVVVVMADCPLVRPESLDALAAAATPLALAPSRDGGVNALALQAVNGFSPPFGVPVGETLDAARAAGLEAAVVDDPLLALDVDRPEDYEAMLACL
ncbi:MAG TPA: 2-phospho-L-lactate guanylyltransferase [Gaiellaceae bacterium]|nr:2-phospho-L-lactate guanylyltransferase [Gaiellaceae bacterium]